MPHCTVLNAGQMPGDARAGGWVVLELTGTLCRVAMSSLLEL